MSWKVERWHDVPGLIHGFGGRVDAAPVGVRTLRQVHGTSVRVAAEAPVGEAEGDGLVADRAGVAVGVWTADCVPILLVAARARVAAAVHSGWRGSAAGIVGKALALLMARWNLRAAEVEAALGPAIDGCCYTVGDEVRGAFVERLGERACRGFTQAGERLTLDLRTALAAELADLGVGRVERVGPCTSCRSDLLFSFRREGGSGRQLSYAGWDISALPGAR